MFSSGTTAFATAADGAVQLTLGQGTRVFGELTIINEATFAGFICLNGNAGPWARIPAGPASRTFRVTGPIDPYVMRVPSGGNLSLFADAREA